MPRCTRALISVSDKAGVVALATRLHKLKIEILSTGGTAIALRQAGIPVTDVADITGFPGNHGRTRQDAAPADPRRPAEPRRTPMPRSWPSTASRPSTCWWSISIPSRPPPAAPGCTREDAIENIDIGGPAMIRGAAKNQDFVAVMVDPADYERVLGELEAGGSVFDDNPPLPGPQGFRTHCDLRRRGMELAAHGRRRQ